MEGWLYHMMPRRLSNSALPRFYCMEISRTDHYIPHPQKPWLAISESRNLMLWLA
jgi:hypothetical protein